MGFAATELPRQNSSGDVADGNRAGERHGDGSIATKTSRGVVCVRECVLVCCLKCFFVAHKGTLLHSV